MKKRWMLGIAASLLAFCLVGCGKDKDDSNKKKPESFDAVATEEVTTTTEAEPEAFDAETFYAHTVRSYYDYVMSYGSETMAEDGMMSALEQVHAVGQYNTLNTMGYAYIDMNGDGKEELLIGLEDFNTPKEANTIYALYTDKDGSPELVFEGWSRSAYMLLSGKKIMFQGSGGAASSGFGDYVIDENGNLKCNNLYFTAPMEDDFYSIEFYHNQTGEWDEKNSEKLDILEDKFWDMNSEMFAEREWFPITTFLEYANKEGLAIPEDLSSAGMPEYVGGSVFLVSAEDIMQFDKEYYTRFDADTSEYQVLVGLATDDRVSNFQVWSLDLDTDGSLLLKDRLYGMDCLSSDMPLVLGVAFPGTVPQYGFTYEDYQGVIYYFAICQSGEDGSYFLMEF